MYDHLSEALHIFPVSHARVFTWRRWSAVMRSALNDRIIGGGVPEREGGVPEQFYRFLLGAAKAALIEIPS